MSLETSHLRSEMYSSFISIPLLLYRDPIDVVVMLGGREEKTYYSPIIMDGMCLPKLIC